MNYKKKMEMSACHSFVAYRREQMLEWEVLHVVQNMVELEKKLDTCRGQFCWMLRCPHNIYYRLG